jgi:hypothetical protein
MTWTLLIVAITGTFTADIKMHQIPMNNELACKAAALKIAETSKGIGFFCISSNTGEVFEVKK